METITLTQQELIEALQDYIYKENVKYFNVSFDKFIINDFDTQISITDGVEISI